MSQSGSQAAAFFKDVRQSGVVWLVRDDDGSPTHFSADGTRSLPFWSTSARAASCAWRLRCWLTCAGRGASRCPGPTAAAGPALASPEELCPSSTRPSATVASLRTSSLTLTGRE
ncbi:DUF2750 domain-containing protein [Streptomyces sp. NPDC002688]|uniref:DUF2750 domain-containing protein n=1 Tax=Streptomyces sp. NPDC002688 TaxID=3154423 RepID=UPI00332B9FF7